MRLDWQYCAVGIALVGLAGGRPAAVRQDARVRTVLTHRLPAPGDSLDARILEVRYGPGDSSVAHSHPCPVLVYVVRGALRSATESTPEAIYHAGDTFYEAPNGEHRVSANASERDSVLFTATFLCPATREGGGR